MKLDEILKSRVSELEAIVYLLCTGDKPMSFRDLAERLGLSHTTIANIYHEAEVKINGRV